MTETDTSEENMLYIYTYIWEGREMLFSNRPKHFFCENAMIVLCHSYTDSYMFVRSFVSVRSLNNQ